MSKPTPADQPYLTFSEDWCYAFVERVSVTATRMDALDWLDRRLRDHDPPAVPRVRSWIRDLAHVLGVESWDEADGVRLRRRVPGSRVLWRVDVSSALELEPPDRAHDRRLIDRLLELHAQDQLSGEEVARARLLHAAVEEAEAERLMRQRLRAPDAPRAPMDPSAAAPLARLMLTLMGALGARPDEHGDEVSRALRGMEQRLAAEEERQVMALRAELDALGLG